MTRRQYAGGAAAALTTGAIASSGGGTVTIDNTAGWPDGSIGKFHVVLDAGTSAEEKILIDLRSGSSLNFSSGGRGADGTVSTSHAIGATIWICYTALDADESNAHINTQNPAHQATVIYFTPAGTIIATNVQAAIQALDGTDNVLDTRIDTLEALLAIIQQDNWVTQQRLSDNSVGTAELIDGSVNSAKIANGSIVGADLAPGGVGEAALGSGTATWVPVVSQGPGVLAKTVNEARYSRVGGLCFFWLDLTIGSSGTAGQPILISLPFPVQGHSGAGVIGSAYYIDPSVASNVQFFCGSFGVGSNSSNVTIVGSDPQTSGVWGLINSAPATAGDTIRGFGCYRWA